MGTKLCSKFARVGRFLARGVSEQPARLGRSLGGVVRSIHSWGFFALMSIFRKLVPIFVCLCVDLSFFFVLYIPCYLPLAA